MNLSPDRPLPVQTRWRLRLLGAFELRDGQHAHTRLPSRAVMLLLARLALGPGREHSREELVDLLWPEVGLDVGRNRLRQALSTLRSVIEPAHSGCAPVLLADRRALRLLPGSVACDVDDFHAALRRGDSAAAIQCYGGELLPGFFDDWVVQERLRLAALADGLQPVPATPGAVQAAPALLPAAAAAPQAAAPPAAVPGPLQHRLPVYLTRMMGFDAAGAALAAAVRQHRLVVLRGPGGAGKTRLAVEVARSLAQAGGWGESASPAFDSVVFVPLAACEQRAACCDAVLLALQRDAAANDTAGSDFMARLEGALAGRQALLVLDNFEQLVDEARQDLAAWLQRLPGLHLLVTSRRALGLDGEVEQALAALPLPTQDASLQALALSPAVALFVDRARAVRADFHLTERNRSLVVDVVRELHGLPLALELAAARIRSVTLADMLAMLRSAAQGEPGRGLALLSRSGPRAADDARHASMLRVVEWSWLHLGVADRDRLTVLAVFAGGATLQALHDVEFQARGGIDSDGAAEVAAGLDDLVAASVAFVRDGSGGVGRYHAFEPVREYALNGLDEPRRAALRQQHLQAMLAWARRLGLTPALDPFRDELPNLLAALATAEASGQPALALRLALDCAAALDDVALPASALALLRRAVAALEEQAQAADAAPGETAAPPRMAVPSAWQPLAAAAHALLAHRSFDAGQREQALDHAARALALAPAGSAGRAAVLYAAARVHLRVLDDGAAASRLSDEALTLARQHGLWHVQAQTLTLQAVLAVRVQHDLERDQQLKRQALALWQAHGATTRVAAAQVGLSISLGFAHRVEEQLALLHQVRLAAAANGQRSLWAFASSVQGYALADLARWDESAASYLDCLRSAWEIGAWREWFYALWNLPRTLAHGRRPQPAARLMGFADAFFSQRFGTLGWEDLRERRRTRRLVRVQVGPALEARLWQEGRQLSMAQAMALATAEAASVAEAAAPAAACGPASSQPLSP